jgi:kexin
VSLLTGCGGGGGGGGGSSAATGGGSAFASGVFIDAPVQGLTYRCSSGLSGTTDAAGTFTCYSGDSVSFYANGIYIGTAPVAATLTPYRLWSDAATAINVAQLLQTVDEDASANLIVVGSITLDSSIDIRSDDFDTQLDNNTTNPIVSAATAQNTMDVHLDSHDLTFEDIKKSNNTENAITSDLNLPATGAHGTTITWSSSATAYLNNNGSVTRADYLIGDQSITLTATIEKDGVSTGKSFTLNVLKLPINDTESVTVDTDALDFSDIKNNNTAENSIIFHLTLPSTGSNGTTISWDSNNTTALAHNGMVTRPTVGSNDTSVTLTATISKGSANQSKSFTLTIKAHMQATDNDNDHIPDDIEELIGFDSSNDDEDSDGIPDGIDESIGDPFYKNQWHLKARGTVVNNTAGVATQQGNDLGLDNVYKKYMGYNGGNPIIVSVVDNGTDADHEDLIDNMDLTRSRNAATRTNGDPSPTDTQIHGTMVAGIIGARGFNAKGVRGVAPFVKIAGNNWLSYQTYDELERAWVTGNGANEIAISNNSWGSEYDNDLLMEELLRVGATTLRDGKGRIYVKAAGNSRYARGNSNLSNNANNSYIITVAALKHDNTHASYSSFGSNILISGYSGDYYNTAPTIGTTTRAGDTQLPTWSDDSAHNYTYAMNGTSAAAPTVSGAIALILEACPNLTYRDVKYILAKTATRVDSSNSTWVKNAADLWHSIDYGYGLINADAAIALCQDAAYTNLGVEQSTANTVSFNTPIPDTNQAVAFTVPLSATFDIEWIGVYVDISSHTWQGDLEITLTSPSGTTTQLVQGNNVLKNEGSDSDGFYNGNGRLGSSAFIDESVNGDWVVHIKDTLDDDSGTLETIKIEAKGH